VWIRRLIFSPDSRYLVVLGEQGELELCDLAARTRSQLRPPVGVGYRSTAEAAFDPSGGRLFYPKARAGLVVYDLARPKILIPLVPLTGVAKGIAVREVGGGVEVVVALDEHTLRQPPAHVLRQWTVPAKGSPHEREGPPPETNLLTALGFAPGLDTFVTAERVRVEATPRGTSQHTMLRVRRFDSRQTTAAALVPPSFHWVSQIALSSDGRLAAAVTAPRVTVHDLTVPNSPPVAVLKGRRGSHLHGAAFHPGGRHLALGGNNGTVTVYDTATWAVEKAYDWELGPLRAVAFSPSGTLGAAGSLSGTVVVWDVDL
jgi:WD40 repeat protein